MPPQQTSNTKPLYAQPRSKTKTTPIPLSATSIHALGAELLSAKSAAAAQPRSAPARSRPDKTDLFRSARARNKGVAVRAARDLRDGGGATSGEIGDVEDRQLERSRQRLREKAR